MTDLHDLLERAAGPFPVASATELQADVDRGRRALRRRRAGAAGGLVTLAVAATAIPVAAGGLPSTRSSAATPGGPAKASSTLTVVQQQQIKRAQTQADLAQQDAIKKARQQADLAASRVAWRADGSAVPLRAYAGPALAGSFQPGLMPEGAIVQGGSAYRLTIARSDDPDTNPDSFVGKVVIMLSGQQPASDAAEITARDPFSTTVLVPLAKPIDGAAAVEVQFAPGLGWTDHEAISFASSIHVRGTALSAKG